MARLADLPTDAPDLADAFDMAAWRSVHAAILDRAVDVADTRSIALLHAAWNTNFYVDLDRFIGDPSPALDRLLEALREVVALTDADLIAAAVTERGLLGSGPLASQVAASLDLGVVFVSDPGRRNVRLAGAVDRTEGARVVIVGDVMTTGTSACTARDALVAAGATVVGVVTVFDRMEGGADKLAEAGLDGVALLSRRSLREYCDDVTRSGEAPAAHHAKATALLARTRRIAVATRRIGSRAPSPTRLAVAPRLAPPPEAFDDSYRFLPEWRGQQLAAVGDAARAAARAGCSFLVLPELSVPLDEEPLLDVVRATGVTLVGGGEYDGFRRNTAVVATSSELCRQAKLVMSPYDLKGMRQGDAITVFEGTELGRFAVLVCADQMDDEVVDAIAGRVDVVIVVARNPAVTTAASISVADAYRRYAFVLFVNDRSLGPSYLASPRKGAAEIIQLDDVDLPVVEIDVPSLRAGGVAGYRRRVAYDRRRWDDAPP